MTVQEALGILNQVCKERQGNRDDHDAMKQALQVVTTASTPMVAGKEAVLGSKGTLGGEKKEESNGNK